VCFGHMNFMLLNICHTEDTKNEGNANNIMHRFMCEEQHMHNERVWNIKHGLVHHSFTAGPAAPSLQPSCSPIVYLPIGGGVLRYPVPK